MSAAPVELPATGLAGLKQNARFDVLSGFLVFLIALPLCIGISLASGFPPVAGIFTAILGGLFGVVLGSAPMTIKGPAAGLIVIVFGAVQELGGGDPVLGYKRALAVGFVAALLQIAFALLRAGRLGEVFPVSVVHGMLAAIGVIIFAKQVHVMLGVKPTSTEPLELIAEIPRSVASANPAIALIGVVALLVLFLLPKAPMPWARKLPGPLLVLLVAIPLGQVFGLSTAHTMVVGVQAFEVGPRFLVQLPASLYGAITFPDFSVITSAVSIKYVVMYALVGTIESLLSAKAVDTLDPYKRRSDLDRDLLAVGVANLAAASIGGLPMISEIVRSSANISNGARTSWSNFFHGAFLLLFVVAAPGLVQMIPLAALAAMLVYTGTRLAAPTEFRRTWKVGPDQMLVFITTLVLTLSVDLLVGVVAGIVVEVLIHVYNGTPVWALFRSEVSSEQTDEEVVVRVGKAAVFTNYLGIGGALRSAVAAGVQTIVIDLSEVVVIDHTVMEKLHEFEHSIASADTQVTVLGLEGMRPRSLHPMASRTRG